MYQILFALAEALHTHGYTKEACKLARQLAEEMLSAAAASSDTCTSYTPAVDHPSHHPKGTYSEIKISILLDACPKMFLRRDCSHGMHYNVHISTGK